MPFLLVDEVEERLDTVIEVIKEQEEKGQTEDQTSNEQEEEERPRGDTTVKASDPPTSK
jgi:hypothetical protein